MAISQLGSTVTDFDNTATNSDITTSYTQSAGTDTLLVAILTSENDVSHDSVEFDGNALTKQVDLGNPTNERRVTIWTLVDPPVTTGDIIATFGGNADFGVIYHSWQGVDQVVPVNAVASAEDVSGLITVTINSAVDDLVIDGFAHDDDDVDPTAGAGQTELADLSVVGDFRCGSSRKDGASPTVTMEWSTDVNDWVHCAISLNPAAAIGAPDQPIQMVL